MSRARASKYYYFIILLLFFFFLNKKFDFIMNFMYKYLFYIGTFIIMLRRKCGIAFHFFVYISL